MKKGILLTASLLCVMGLTGVFGQDDGSFGSDFGSFFETDDTGSGGGSALTFNGSADLFARAYLSEDSLDAMGDDGDVADVTEINPSLSLDLEYKKESSDLRATINLDPSVFTEHPEDVLEELTYSLYLGSVSLDVGKMKVVWGRGDNLHVLDPFNANDYSDFLIPDYLDRRLAEPMARLTWSLPASMKLEFIWTPMMTPDRIPTEGAWVSEAAQNLVALGTSYVTYQAVSAYIAAGGTDPAGTLAMLSTIDSTTMDSLLPDTSTLDYGQYGIRWTGVLGPVDLGAEYYLGHYKTPSYAYSYSTLAGSTYVSSLDLTYDRLQIFGLDGAGVIGPFNLRCEAAYYLTEDIEGDDSSVHNNSIQWLGGFDVDLPISNLNLNAQVIGSYILNNDGITSSSDVDYNNDEIWTNDKLVVKLSDSYRHEKIKPSITAVWGIEQKDFLIQPRLELDLRDDFTVSASGAYIVSDDGEFEAYEDSCFAEVSASYSF